MGPATTSFTAQQKSHVELLIQQIIALNDEKQQRLLKYKSDFKKGSPKFRKKGFSVQLRCVQLRCIATYHFA